MGISSRFGESARGLEELADYPEKTETDLVRHSYQQRLLAISF
jgi:hypothetical protein